MTPARPLTGFASIARAAIAAAAIALWLIAVAALPARAAVTIDAVAASLSSNPVYNESGAENELSNSDAIALRQQVDATELPIYVAVVSQATAATVGGTASSVATALEERLGENAVYAVVAGEEFEGSSAVADVVGFANTAIAEYGNEGSYEVLSVFVEGVDQAYGTGKGDSPVTGPGFPWFLVIAGGAAAGGGALLYRSSKKARLRAIEELDGVKQVIDEDVTEYGERLRAFDMSDPRLDEEGRTDLGAALDHYEKAKDAVAAMRSESDAGLVTQALADGRWHISRVEARLNGQPLPERTPPCFVDPRHGPSAETVEWNPGGGPRPVPMCTACAERVRAGAAMKAREVPVAGGQRKPYWEAGGQYGGYAGGYYRNQGNVLPTILIGTMLGQMMSGSSGSRRRPTSYGGGTDGGYGGGSSGGFFQGGRRPSGGGRPSGGRPGSPFGGGGSSSRRRGGGGKLG